VGPRAGLDRCGKLAPNGIRSPDRPARSESLYRLSYHGPQILAFNVKNWCAVRAGFGHFQTAVVQYNFILRSSAGCSGGNEEKKWSLS
jgi:hypothetical protein